MNILLIGPQGSGKGTLSELLVKDFGLYHLDAGKLIRDVAKSDPNLNQMVNEKGDLVPDDIVFSIISRRIDEEKPDRDDVLFDGFPRSVAQYLLLKDWLGQVAQKLDKAIYINISHDESIRRLSARRICSSCGKIWNLVEFPKPPSQTKCDCGGNLYQREDDMPEAIKERLINFEKVTASLVEMLDGEGKLFEVGGEHPIEDVYVEVAGIINK